MNPVFLAETGWVLRKSLSFPGHRGWKRKSAARAEKQRSWKLFLKEKKIEQPLFIIR